jgi:hypothetical protein
MQLGYRRLRLVIHRRLFLQRVKSARDIRQSLH